MKNCGITRGMRQSRGHFPLQWKKITLGSHPRSVAKALWRRATVAKLGLCQGISLDKVRDEDSFARRWCGRIAPKGDFLERFLSTR